MRLIRERVTGTSGAAAFSWAADRGLALTGAGGEECLLLASPDRSDEVMFVSGMGFYRRLVDPGVPETPGATVRELLGYGDWKGELEIEVEVEPL